MTRAEENVLRATLNPWPLSVSKIAKNAGRSQATVDRHLATLRVHRMVKRYDSPDPSRPGKFVRSYMATDAGTAAIVSIDRMREPHPKGQR